MRAVTVDGPLTVPGVRQMPVPEPGPAEILVSVRASSVNAADRAIASGDLLTSMDHEFPIMLGHDFAGVVESVGSDATRFSEGDEVFGFVSRPKLDLRSGTWADYIVLPEDRFVAKKPPTLGFVQAGALPLAGVAALMAVDAVDPQPGDVVLVAGGTGGLGGYVVELGAVRGATVIAIAAPTDAARLVKLGAREAVDCTVSDLAAELRRRLPKVDALIDTSSNAEQFCALVALLESSGRAATTCGVAAAVERADVRTSNVSPSPEPEQLSRLARLADGGRLRPTIENVYPLEGAGEAIDEFSAGSHGKIALLLANGQ